MTQELLNQLIGQADTLTPDEQLHLATHLQQMAQQANPSEIIRSRWVKIQTYKPEILALAAKYGASNLRVFSLTQAEGGVSDREVNFLVKLESGRSLLDQGGLLIDLRKLLEFELYIFTEEGLKENYREMILEKAVPL